LLAVPQQSRLDSRRLEVELSISSAALHVGVRIRAARRCTTSHDVVRRHTMLYDVTRRCTTSHDVVRRHTTLYVLLVTSSTTKHWQAYSGRDKLTSIHMSNRSLYDVVRRRTTLYDVARRCTTSHDVVRVTCDIINNKTLASLQRSRQVNKHSHE